MGRSSRKRRSRKATAGGPGTPGRAPLPDSVVAAALFAVSLALRLLFGHATADAGWAYSAAYKGDAPLWLDYALALKRGQPFELGLPLHPPGTAYLVAALWDGTRAGLQLLRSAWAVLGAATVVAAWAAVKRAFGQRTALLAGCLMAASSSLLVLSGSVNSEAPYLLLVALSLLALESFRCRRAPLAALAFGGLSGLACLFRVEHAPLVLLGVPLALGWRQAPITSAATRLRAVSLPLALALGFVLPILPWQAHVARAVREFNGRPPQEAPGHAAALSSIEAATAHVAWDAEAAALRNGLPAFARRAATAFVAATVAHRGGATVTASDFTILEEAFGYVPRPLTPRAFISLYGPLNFALANHPRASGGFSRVALEELPPLAGGVTRYPPLLVSGPPPPDLTLAYPPHVRLVNEGYALGVSWIVRDPWAFLRRAARKLAIFWSGASFGLTGYNWPLGLSGTRRAVDMVAPNLGPAGWVWSLFVLAVAGLGLARGRGRPGLAPWIAFALTKVVVAVAFFGYARQGALLAPVLAILVALACEPLLARPNVRVEVACGVLLAVALGLEGLRWRIQPSVAVDGHVAGAQDPSPADTYRDELVEYRY